MDEIEEVMTWGHTTFPASFNVYTPDCFLLIFPLFTQWWNWPANHKRMTSLLVRFADPSHTQGASAAPNPPTQGDSWWPFYNQCMHGGNDLRLCGCVVVPAVDPVVVWCCRCFSRKWICEVETSHVSFICFTDDTDTELSGDNNRHSNFTYGLA